MRTLDFSPTDKDIFEFIYTGLMVTPKELDRKGHRLHSNIQDKFELVSHKNEHDIRVLNPVGGKILLEEDEFKLMIDCVESVKFLPKVSKQVNSMWDFLDSVKEEKLIKVV